MGEENNSSVKDQIKEKIKIGSIEDPILLFRQFVEAGISVQELVDTIIELKEGYENFFQQLKAAIPFVEHIENEIEDNLHLQSFN